MLPDAYVRRLDDNPGFGAAANDVREVVDGAAFYCFLHDDAAPDAGAITTMVGEALRSNAGIVGPKLVQLDDDRRLLQVGESADKTGERVDGWSSRASSTRSSTTPCATSSSCPAPARSCAATCSTPSAGSTPGIDLLNDDLNLCWRAHVAGARVIVAPDAVVRHVEALGDRVPVSERRERLIRHRLRTMLSCYSRWHLLRVLPQAMVVGGPRGAVLAARRPPRTGRRGGPSLALEPRPA